VFQEVFQRIRTTAPPQQLPHAACCRLALLVTGILAAKSTVVAQIAAELAALRLTHATQTESVTRRLRRTLNDPHLTPAACYTPLLKQVVDWPQLVAGSRRVVLVIDERTKADEIHLLRVSLPYWGGSLPLAWEVWEQNVPLPDGEYWRRVERLLADVAAQVPPDLEVVVVADAFFAIPGFVDRLARYGWHWVIRVTPGGSHRFRDQQGRESGLGERVRQQVSQPGQRWKARGALFKDAGGYGASVVATWTAGAEEPVVVLSDLPPRWSLLRHYDRRFWCEPGFRTDKTRGWQGERSQVQGVAHHAVLLLGMAWASLVTLCLGVEEARARLAAEAARPVDGKRPGRPRHARESVFTLGRQQLRAWLSRTGRRTLRWHLPEVDAISWSERWHQQQALRLIVHAPVRP
jgi:Transposase DDE domain